MKEHPDENQSNLMALYGISLDGMGRFLYETGKYNEALPSKLKRVESEIKRET